MRKYPEGAQPLAQQTAKHPSSWLVLATQGAEPSLEPDH